MRATGHIAVSVGVGLGFWLATKSAGAAAISFVVGVFIDSDHILDYFRWFVLGKKDTFHVLFHSWELVIPLVLASFLSGWNVLLVAATVAFVVHMGIDQTFNPVKPFSYFITYRAIKRFVAKEVAGFIPAATYRDPTASSVKEAIISFFWRGGK